MFVLKKCLTPFLVPPGIFILLLLAVAWRLRLRRQHGHALALVLIALAFWSVSTAPFSRFMIDGLERGLSIPEHPRGDVIIVLGGGSIDKVPDLSGRGIPAGDSLHRVVTAARLQKRLGIPVIASGGRVFPGRTAEAVINRRFLIDLGVPADSILIEDRSRDTMENARFTRQILENNGFRRPLLVTSAYHMRRSVAAFRQTGIEVTPVPAHFMSGGDAPAVWFDWLPNASSMTGVALALKEQIGFLFQRLSAPEGT